MLLLITPKHKQGLPIQNYHELYIFVLYFITWRKYRRKIFFQYLTSSKAIVAAHKENKKRSTSEGTCMCISRMAGVSPLLNDLFTESHESAWQDWILCSKKLYVNKL